MSDRLRQIVMGYASGLLGCAGGTALIAANVAYRNEDYFTALSSGLGGFAFVILSQPVSAWLFRKEVWPFETRELN